MPFQQSVNTYPAAGVTGQRAGLNPIAMLLPVPLAGGEDGVTVGHAVWFDPDAPTTVIMSNAGTSSGEPAQTTYDKPLGIVVRDMASTIPCADEATMQIEAGRPVAVAVRCDLLIAAPAAATVGQKIFANYTTGALSLGAAGGSVASSVETDWVVRSAGQAGDIIHISNW